MYEFRVHTLVEITENGVLSKPFPFKTPSGEVVHDKQTLAIARNQNNNFNTMLQLLQIRGNITWEVPPMKVNEMNLLSDALRVELKQLINEVLDERQRTRPFGGLGGK